MIYYTQCKMEKKKQGCIITQTSWIPSKFAKMGKYLRLKDEDGWQVVGVYTSLSMKDVKNAERNHKHHRKATDI